MPPEAAKNIRQTPWFANRKTANVPVRSVSSVRVTGMNLQGVEGGLSPRQQLEVQTKAASTVWGMMFAQKPKEKVSPVAATAAGDTITETALETEMTAAGVPIDAQDVRQAALDRIVNRKLMSKAAREQGLVKTPAGVSRPVTPVDTGARRIQPSAS